MIIELQEAMESFAFPDKIKIKLMKLHWSYEEITLMKKISQKIFVRGFKATCLTQLNHPNHQTLDRVLTKLGGHINLKGA